MITIYNQSQFVARMDLLADLLTKAADDLREGRISYDQANEISNNLGAELDMNLRVLQIDGFNHLNN